MSNTPKIRINKKEFQHFLESIDHIENTIPTINNECLIPRIKGELPHDDMRNCHIISEGYLKRIKKTVKKQDQILAWPISASTIGRLLLTKAKSGQVQSLSDLRIEKYSPILMGTNDRRVKYTYACGYHDNKVFDVIDNVNNFNPNNPETQFILSFRTILAYAVLLKAHKQLAQNEFKKDSSIDQILMQYPQLQPSAASMAFKLNRKLTNTSKQYENFLQDWQKAYIDGYVEKITSYATTARTKLRIAGTGIKTNGRHQIAVTILPSEKNYSCTIIVTTLEPGKTTKWPMEFELLSKVHQEAERVKDLVQNQQPSEWLEWLLELGWEFIYISPDDYYNNNIITEEERNSLEHLKAQKMTKNLRQPSWLSPQ